MQRRTALLGSLAAATATLPARAQSPARTPVDLQLVLAVDVSRSIDEVEAELQRRREDFTPVPHRYTSGVLYKYAKLVGSASHGAVCD